MGIQTDTLERTDSEERVDDGTDDERTPEITVESATTAIVLAHPKMRRRREAGPTMAAEPEPVGGRLRTS